MIALLQVINAVRPEFIFIELGSKIMIRQKICLFIYLIRLIKTENSNIYDMVFVFVETFRVIYTYLDSGRYCKIQTALET